MQGSGKKDSISESAISFGQKKIIEFPIGFRQKKYKRPTSKFSSKTKIIVINMKRGAVRDLKKLSIVPLNNKPYLCPFFEKENLIFLIAHRKNNFQDKFSQGDLYRGSMKITHSFRSPWASNLPRY
jgi:hypothetical protein